MKDKAQGKTKNRRFLCGKNLCRAKINMHNTNRPPIGAVGKPVQFDLRFVPIAYLPFFGSYAIG